MSDAEKLELLADLYADHPDAVPEGMVFDIHMGRPYLAYFLSDTQRAAIPLKGNPWMLQLALGALREKLEAGGVQIIKQPCGRWCIFRMFDHGLEPHGEPLYECPIRTADVAYRMMKETDHADS